MLGRTLAPRTAIAWRPALQRCFARRRLTTLERRVGDNLGTDDALFDQSNFDGSVYPDLPVVGPEMAGDIDAAIRQRVQEESAGEGLIIRTVAAQCLDAERIARKIERSGNLFRGSKGVRGALLCVSGGDRGRRSGKVGSSELKDSRFIIEAAASMRSRGEIPAHVDLWAVANPMTDSVDSFKCKVDAGARCFLTQPPFLAGRSKSWFEQVAGTEQARDGNVDVLVGVPIITSTKNLAFWFDLCGLSESTDLSQMLASFPDQAPEAAGSPRPSGPSNTPISSDRMDALIDWNASFIRDVASRMPGVAGLHVMPVTLSGLRMMNQVMQRAMS